MRKKNTKLSFHILLLNLILSFSCQETQFADIKVQEKSNTTSNDKAVCVNGTLVPVQEVFFQENANKSKVDILWVVDNSGSMSNEQEALANNFEIFINDFIDRNLDFNMAVTTTGKIIGSSTDSSAYQSDDRYKIGETYYFVDYGIMEGDASLLTSDAAFSDRNQFINNFKSIIQVGTNGSGKESGLKSSLLFLERNELWGRDDAYLTIVYISDEEDSSGNSVTSYIDQIKLLKDNPDKIKAYSIVKKVIASQFETLGTRYELATSLTNGETADIDKDFSTTLKNFADSILNLIDSFSLSDSPFNNKVTVKVNGTSVSSGWSYSVKNNALSFIKGSIPKEGSRIEVNYQKCLPNASEVAQ